MYFPLVRAARSIDLNCAVKAEQTQKRTACRSAWRPGPASPVPNDPHALQEALHRSRRRAQRQFQARQKASVGNAPPQPLAFQMRPTPRPGLIRKATDAADRCPEGVMHSPFSVIPSRCLSSRTAPLVTCTAARSPQLSRTKAAGDLCRTVCKVSPLCEPADVACAVVVDRVRAHKRLCI